MCDMLLLTWIELLVEQRNKIKISLYFCFEQIYLIFVLQY